jgi:hypothetical protein
MSTPAETVRQFMEAFIAAWPERDPSRLESFFSEDAVYTTDPRSRSRAAEPSWPHWPGSWPRAVGWAGEKPSKFNISHLSEQVNTEGEAGFSGSFAVSGSYAGTGQVSAWLTNASTAQIAACAGSISQLQLDSSTSSSSI